MHKITLKDWVLLLTILPTLIIGLILTGYFSYLRQNELENFVDTQARSILDPAALASAPALYDRNRQQLRQLISAVHKAHSDIIRGIAVFTQDNQMFVSSTYQSDYNILRIKPGEALPEKFNKSDEGNFYIYRSPIIEESFNFSDDLNNNHQPQIGYIAIKFDPSNIKYQQQKELIGAFSILAVALLVAAIFSLMLVKMVTRPITAMVSAIDRIQEGKLESRVSGHLLGELNFLKNGINAMAQSLGDYRDEMQKAIEQATIDLRESLEEYEMQNVQLDMAKKKAQQANEVKSEFLANMSHELRTPLNGVLGFTRQTLKTPLNEVQRDYLQTIERSANNLLVLINDILDFSKLDAGKMTIENMPFSLRENIEEALTLLASSAHTKNIELSVRIADQVPDSLMGDVMRIKQILINLTNNAIKFTKQGSVTIDIEAVKVESESALIKVTVNDTGIGMDAEQQENIFQAFGQADKSVTRVFGGTGLGLVISQRLSKEMGGNIGFRSELNKGSSFWFTFHCELNPLPFSVGLDVSNLVNKSILYFEEHTHSRLATNEILSRWHMTITPVSTLAQLTEIVEQKRQFDYALIGHNVSPSALDQLKNIIQALKSTVGEIYLAINSTAPYLQESLMACGAKNCISKPVTETKLAKVLSPANSSNLFSPVDANKEKLNIKVLAVDDNEANLKLIEALLLEYVTDVSLANNGSQAVELCKNENFSIIFMDIQMPVMDGVTALQHIKQSNLNENTPIIAVTAHALQEEKEKLLAEGFSDYVTKPIDEAMLKHSLYEYCDINLFEKDIFMEPNSSIIEVATENANIFDQHLALQRAANNKTLAHEMLSGLIASLPQTKLEIEEAITEQNIELIKSLVHKINGACCYTGVPNLAKITNAIETELKRGMSLDDLQPEWLEFFEHIEQLLENAEHYLDLLT